MRICIPGPPSLLPPSHFETKARGIVPVPSSFFLHRTPSVHLQTTKKKGHGHAESRTRPPSRFFVPPPSNPGTRPRPRPAFLFTRPPAVRLPSKHPPQRTTSTHIRVPSPPKPQSPIPTRDTPPIPSKFSPRLPHMSRHWMPHQIVAFNVYLLDGTRCVPPPLSHPLFFG